MIRYRLRREVTSETRDGSLLLDSNSPSSSLEEYPPTDSIVTVSE